MLQAWFASRNIPILRRFPGFQRIYSDFGPEIFTKSQIHSVIHLISSVCNNFKILRSRTKFVGKLWNDHSKSNQRLIKIEQAFAVGLHTILHSDNFSSKKSNNTLDLPLGQQDEIALLVEISMLSKKHYSVFDLSSLQRSCTLDAVLPLW